MLDFPTVEVLPARLAEAEAAVLQQFLRGLRGTVAGKEWLSVISTGGPADSYQAGGYNHFAMSEFLKPLVQTAHLLQMTFLPPFIFHGAVRADAGAVAASAEQLATYVHDPLLDPVKRLAALQAQMTQDGVKLG